MSSHAERTGPRIELTQHEYGMSVKIIDRDPEIRYRPVDRREFRRALDELRRKQSQKR